MCDIKLEWIISFVIVTVTCATFNEDTFTAVETLANKVCPVDRRLLEYEARSRVDCMTKAAQRNGCTGVGYHGNSKMCYVCDTYQETTGAFLSLTGATFYQRVNAVPPGFSSVAGYAVLPVYYPTMTYYAAEDACARHSATLVRIDTAQKRDAIWALLLDPSNVAATGDIWIQLKLVVVIDRWLLNTVAASVDMWIQLQQVSAVWQFDDGTPAPMTNDYWFPNEPGGGAACGQMIRSLNYKWDNTECYHKKGFICEI